MSQTADSSIYTGLWINWSHGAIVGSTITLNERDGGLLTAFLAIFVSTAGAACWKVLSFTVHQRRARQDYQDGLHVQQQAILRNTGSAAGSSWEFIKSAWYWRTLAEKPIVRSLPLATLAIFHLVVFGIAGIFSSEVTKAAGDETLINSPNCGFLNLTATGTKLGNAAFTAMDLNDTLAASTYSRACYDDSKNVLQCNQYAQQQLKWRFDRNASCPFSPDICLYGGMPAYQMDSDLIDSHTALGINTPKSERVQYRKVTTCSPIHTKGYATTITDNFTDALANGDMLVRYWYGEVVGVTNYTYSYNTHSLADNSDYTLTSFLADAGYSNDVWIPIPALNRTDADVSLFLLAGNWITYEEPVTDPFFTATTPESIPNSDGTNVTYYLSDRYVTALGCADQHQFCNPSNGNCTPLTGWTLARAHVRQLAFNDAQLDTAIRIIGAVEFVDTYSSVHSRGASALRASETVDDHSSQIQLPDTQWMTEVSSWFAVSMAKLQQRIVQYATGPAYIPQGSSLVGPLDKHQEKMCKNQKIRSQSGTTSFSVLGVAIILIVGSVLIFTSLLLDTVVEFLRRQLHWKDYKSLQWTLDDKLQTQRMAYEEAGQGHWTGGASSYPVTRKGDKLGIPQGVNSVHPLLSKTQRPYSDSETSGPEAEGLMTVKGVSSHVEIMQV